EEGKILYDINPRKPKKTKSLYKILTANRPNLSKNNRPMRTSQLFMQDNYSQVSTLHTFKFDCMKNAAAKRTPTLRPKLVNPTTKNPKHAAVLQESGINYDQPLTPIQVAAIRADRIAREKKQSQQAAEQLAQQRAAQTTTTTAVATATTVTAGIVKAATSQAVATAAGATTVMTVSGTLTPASRARVSSAMNIHELSQALANNQRAQGQAGTATAVITTALTAQLVAAQRAAQSTASPATTAVVTAGTINSQLTQATGVTTAKNFTPAQLTMYKRQLAATASRTNQAQQAEALRREQLRKLAAQGKTVSVTSPLITSITSGQVATRPQIAHQIKQGQQAQRPVTEAEMQLLLKQRHIQQQQQKAAQAAAQQASAQAQAQAAQGLTPTQILAQAQQQASSQSPVATLVKTVSGAAGSTSMTIPVSAVNVGGVTIPSKGGTAKVVTAQQRLQQHQLLQLQRNRQAQQQKITLQQVAGKTPIPVNAVQIIQQPLSAQKSPVTVQQIHQIMRQQQQAAQNQGNHGNQAQTIQQIITSVSPASSQPATLIVTQAQPTLGSRVNLPGHVVTTLSQPRASISLTGNTGARQITAALGSSSSLVTGGTIVKPLEHSVASPAQTKPTLTTIAAPKSQTQPQIHHVAVSHAAAASLSHQVAVSHQAAAPTTAVTQASPATMVRVSQAAVSTQSQAAAQAVAQQIQQQAALAQAQAQTGVSPGQVVGQAGQQSKQSPYQMRLRNPPKH
ncbi:unnamed protein product, partial [Owenia fusiformis]